MTMPDVVVGVLALLVGLLLCFRGRSAMRVLLALWGALAGFGLGAVLVDTVTDQGLLASPLGWVAAIVLALVAAALAYVFFAVAVVLAFVSMGYVLGRNLAAGLGAEEPWVIAAVGVAVGALLGLLAVVTNLPDLVLIVVSAFAGASVAVGGLMLLLDATEVADLIDARTSDEPGWQIGQLVLAVVGVVVQLRSRGRSRSVRQTWGAPTRG